MAILAHAGAHGERSPVSFDTPSNRLLGFNGPWKPAANPESTLDVLFVCTGNICRSPTAERLAIAYTAARGIEGLHVSSAGTRAVIGSPIHPVAATVLRELGGDATEFSARQLSPRIASQANLIITMTKAHRDAVLTLSPRHMKRTFTLSELSWLASNFAWTGLPDLAEARTQLSSHGTQDIPDPIGQSLDVFATVGSLIADLLPPVLELCRAR
ncbi:low molecular weight phosphatase family protein [Mycolicibacterium litorale]|uniref:arsenate reductase/protein-tyrosine-phosphatase family protein n=1 Tax=Mycolicibacterium litorale TaxID=758802 RepID=UPI0039A386AE